MSGKIPQAFIDNLLDRVDIVEIIDSRVALKRSGHNYKGLCPFHKEKTPSFSVNADKQFYYCFGCGAGGNSIGFIMEHDRLDFPAAIELLARNAGLDIPREDTGRPDPRKQSEPLYGILEQCARWYQRQLRTHQDASAAIAYLKQRGLTGEIAKHFGIGFAPPGWDTLQKAMGDSEAQRGPMVTAGMLIAKEPGKTYDRFRQRIMFPIRDVRGRVVAFGGRVLGDENPKYLNSPETPVFNKGRELYGLYEARQANRQLQQLLVVEGYMDVVALAQHGISYAVATLGTAVSGAHLERVFRYTPQVIFCFDGDRAGRSAATRALEATMPLLLDGRQANFLFLAEGEDPDSLVRKIGRDQFTALLTNSQPIADYLFESLIQGIDMASFDGRARLSKLALPLIQQAPEGVFKHLLLKELSRLTGLDENTMNSLAQKTVAPEGGGRPPAQARPAPTPPEPPAPTRRPRQKAVQGGLVEKSPIRAALANLLFYPELAALVLDLSEFHQPDTIEEELLLEMLEILQRQPETTTNSLLGSWLNTEKHAYAAKLLGFEDLLDNTDKSKQEFLDAMDRVREDKHQRLLERELQALGELDSHSAQQKTRYMELLTALHANRH